MKNTHLLSTGILAIAIIITGFFLGDAYRNRNRQPNKVYVKGMAEKDFKADLAVWSGSLQKKNADMKIAFAELKKDAEKVKEFLIQNGIGANEIKFSSVNINKDYEVIFDKDGYERRGKLSGYTLDQSVTVESSKLSAVDNVSREISSLISEGIEFSSESPLYYYTKLNELKLELIEEATKNGRLRAEKIADNSGGSLKRLLNGEMGVFQITGKNSNEDYSWGGAFNTTSLEKTASITINFIFEVK